MVARGEIWQVALDPTAGTEIRKPRPCLVVSPPEINLSPRVIVAPLTTGSRPTPYRIPITFQGKSGLVLLDQIRAVDRSRLGRCLGSAEPALVADALRILCVMFEP